MKRTMFPHTVTVYTTAIEYDDEYHETRFTHITVLRGVFLDASKGANVRASGLEGADSVILYIPFGVDAVDGISGKKRKYVPPVEFWKLNNHSEAWTLVSSKGTSGGKDSSSYFIKGEIVDPDHDRAFMEQAHDDVYSVTKIDVKDFGRLAHMEVGGV